MPYKPKRRQLTDEALQLVAQRFRVLSEPVRLKLLTVLEEGEQNVSRLVALTGQSQANVSKHLATLVAAGMVGRRKQGLNTYYYISDSQILELCDLMCHRLEAEFAAKKSPFR
jgi:ArsR family transcriptional regulator